MQQVGQPRAGEDLSMEIDVLFGSERDMSFLSLVRHLPKRFTAKSYKHEWRDDALHYESISLTASGDAADWDTNNDISDLPCAAAECAKLRVGDILKLTTGELVRVSAIDSTAETIDLDARGHGLTTAAAQGEAAFTAYIVGHAASDGADPSDEFYRAPSEKYNYVQILERVIGIGGYVMRSKTSRESERARQRKIALKSLLSQLNYAMWEGYLEADTTNDVYTMRGLREAASNTYNINGALTVAKVYAEVEAMINAGGTPSAIHGHPTVIGRLEQLMSAYVTSGVSEYNAKLTVKKISMHGLDIELHADRHCVNTELWVLDYSRLSYGPLSSDEVSGEFTAVTIEENRNQIKEQIEGFYTLEDRQAAAAIVRGYGCTS
ncbi:MAG: DUF5309 family protein [Candidatus Moranbacteria bacterium]|jgi:hypothetical protein|nr:DUF5309 family protein [Candidatus Moranbacteria bacterium]